jgi:hypothetical protein
VSLSEPHTDLIVNDSGDALFGRKINCCDVTPLLFNGLF